MFQMFRELAFSGQEVLESAPEVDVEDRVDDGIEGRVDVAEPDDEVDQPEVYNGRTPVAERKYDVHEKEWRPTGYKRAHYDGHCPSRPSFLRQRNPLFLFHELVQLPVNRLTRFQYASLRLLSSASCFFSWIVLDPADCETFSCRSRRHHRGRVDGGHVVDVQEAVGIR